MYTHIKKSKIQQQQKQIQTKFKRPQQEMQQGNNDLKQEQNTLAPDFILKLSKMMKENPQIISFSQDGTQVHIHNFDKFVKQLLPSTFRHNKWRSFIRQMNMYNFRKLNRGIKTYIFINSIFYKGNEINYHKIRRKINTKQEEIETQNNIQQQLKLIFTAQCQNLGIANNLALLNLQINNNNQVNSTQFQFNQTHIPNYVFASSGNSVCRANSMPMPTLASLSSPDQNNQLLNYRNPISTERKTYTNSLIVFLQKILEHRKRTQQLCNDIKMNIEQIAKQRKTSQNKNVLNCVKDSIQLIQEVSSKFREKIEGYVDSRQLGSTYQQRNLNVNQNVSGSTNKSVKTNIEKSVKNNNGSANSNNLNNLGIRLTQTPMTLVNSMNLMNMGSMHMNMGINMSMNMNMSPNFGFNINSIDNYLSNSYFTYANSQPVFVTNNSGSNGNYNYVNSISNVNNIGSNMIKNNKKQLIKPNSKETGQSNQCSSKINPVLQPIPITVPIIPIQTVQSANSNSTNRKTSNDSKNSVNPKQAGVQQQASIELDLPNGNNDEGGHNRVPGNNTVPNAEDDNRLALTSLCSFSSFNNL